MSATVNRPRIKNENEVWDTGTLTWVAMLQPSTTGGGGGGTADVQYVEDVPAPANPTGTALAMVRADSLSPLTSANGDIVAARGTDLGELYVNDVTANTQLAALNTKLLAGSTVTGTLLLSGDTVVIDTTGMGTVGIDITGSFGGGSLVEFEALPAGGSSYRSAYAFTDATTAAKSFVTSPNAFVFNCAGYTSFRARLSSVVGIPFINTRLQTSTVASPLGSLGMLYDPSSLYTSSITARGLVVDGSAVTQPISVIDGADVAEGHTTDAAIVSDTSGTVTGFLRGLVKMISSVWDSTAGRLKVAQVGTGSTLTTTWAALLAAGTLDMNIEGMSTVTLQWIAQSGDFNGGVYTLVSSDGTTFISVPGRVFRSNGGFLSDYAPDLTKFDGQLFSMVIPVAGWKTFRLITTAGSATGTATLQVRSTSATPPVTLGLSRITGLDGTVANVTGGGALQVTGTLSNVTAKEPSTAAVAADSALVVAISPNNTPVLPSGAATDAVQTNRTAKAQITDGTRDGTVKAASTLPVLTDTAVVTTQRDPLPAGTNVIGHVVSDSIYITNLDFVSGSNPIYIGLAPPSSATSSAVWQIRKLTYDGSSNLTNIQYAAGTIAFGSIWDNRASLSYS